jgi:hypothetical protein
LLRSDYDFECTRPGGIVLAKGGALSILSGTRMDHYAFDLFDVAQKIVFILDPIRRFALFPFSRMPFERLDLGDEKNHLIVL